jgi:hypothetical protein
MTLITLCGVVGLLIISLASADSPWPTPPPAPPALPPTVERVTTPVVAPPVAGAVVRVIHPLPQGAIPAIPPLPATIFEAAGTLKITIEAGSLDRTIQLTYAPVAPDQAANPGRFQKVVWAFDLKSYDARGREFQPTLRRPWVLQVPVAQIPGNPGDPRQLLFARYEDGRWLPQVTSYFRSDNLLVSRILQTGRFAILAELGPP